MTILNVVQPDEFHPSSFTEIDGKLKVAISSQEGNILQYKDDGLFAAAGGGNGVLERYVYTADADGNVVHKGINFNIYLIDGALSGTVYGIDPNAIDPDDIVYYSGGSLGTTFDDEKYVLDLPWAVEHEQRVVLKMHQNGNPVLWVVRVIRPQGGDVGVLLESVTIVIDEMVNVGDLTTEEPTEGPVIPELNSSHTLMHIGTIPPGMQSRYYSVALYDGDKFAIVELDDDKQPIFDSPDNITGQLALPYTDYSVKEQLSYCPIAGTVIYYDGNNYWGIIPNNRMVLDLPASSNDDVIIGTTLGSGEGGECIVFYSMDSQSISYQILTDLSSDALGDRGTFSAPEGEICDYVVSGTFAHYLYVKDGSYVLQTIDLINGIVSENSLVVHDAVDREAKLIPTALGGVIAYIDKGDMRIVFPNLAQLDTNTGAVSLTLADPTILEGMIAFVDLLPNVGFAMDEMTFFKFYIDENSMALTRLGADISDGSFSIGSAPIPDAYLTLLMSGRMSVPLSYGPTTVGFDGSDDGAFLSYEELELGAVSKLYQSSALFKFDNGLAVLSQTPTGDLGLFKVNEDNSIDITAYELHADYSNTVQGFVETAPALGAAVWKTRAGKIVFVRFSETNSDVVIIELGDVRYSSSSIMITKDVDGNHFVKEMQANDGLELTVWVIAPDDTVTTYNHPDINIGGSTLLGSDILGDKLLAFGSTGGVTNIRVLDARTGAALTQANFAFAGGFHHLKLQRIDHETLLIAENVLPIDNKPASIKVTLLKITATEVTVIKKSTLALAEWEAVDGRSLTNNTFSVDGNSVSYQSAIRDAKRYYVKISASQTDFTVYEQEITQGILNKAGMLLFGGTYPMPRVAMFNDTTVYLQHDLKLTSLNTFPLDMVEHDNSPYATSLTATWNEYNGLIVIDGRLANTYTDAWTYAHLEVETPSGEIHVAKYSIGTNVNGEVKRNLWAIAEPGEYIFRLRHWDGGKTLEARATVPADGKDFRAPIVTPTGDGEWVFSSENTEAASRGVYNVYRSRHPVSIMENFDTDGYVYNNIHTELKNYSIPTEERNGIWYIIVGHEGAQSGAIWTPTFFTYGG